MEKVGKTRLTGMYDSSKAAVEEDAPGQGKLSQFSREPSRVLYIPSLI